MFPDQCLLQAITDKTIGLSLQLLLLQSLLKFSGLPQASMLESDLLRVRDLLMVLHRLLEEEASIETNQFPGGSDSYLAIRPSRKAIWWKRREPIQRQLLLSTTYPFSLGNTICIEQIKKTTKSLVTEMPLREEITLETFRDDFIETTMFMRSIRREQQKFTK